MTNSSFKQYVKIWHFCVFHHFFLIVILLLHDCFLISTLSSSSWTEVKALTHENLHKHVYLYLILLQLSEN